MNPEMMSKQKIRAVFYARCSTEEESQRDALKKQAQEAVEWIEKKQWKLVDSYVESCSGTSRKGREEYNRLYEDLKKDKFDVIVIKSQDRLMRNTKDWYLFVDRLCGMKKRLYLYMEQKFYTADDALITGIKAILAEEYSRELSKKMNLAHRNRQKNGGTPVLTSNTYGYRKQMDHSIVIEENEAAVKRRMYELCAGGYGGRAIAKILAREGICNRRGGNFSGADILRMIRNPMNKGTIVMNRSHYEFETGKTVKNPESEQFIYEEKIPAIVSEELYERANREIDRRKKIYIRTEKSNKNASGKYPLSQKLFCGQCGCVFYRTTRKNRTKTQTIHEWKCKNFLARGGNPQEGGCTNIHLEEEKLYLILEETICSLGCSGERKDQVIDRAMKLLGKTLQEDDGFIRKENQQKKRRKIRQQMDLLLDKLLEGTITDEQYQRKYHVLEQQMKLLDKTEKQEETRNPVSRQEERLKNIELFLQQNRGRSAVDAVLLETDQIFVWPEYLLLIPKTENRREDSLKPLRINYRFCLENEKNSHRQKEQRKILEYMAGHPKTTARELSDILGISLSAVNYRIRILRKEGRICYVGKGGHGSWKIIGQDQKR
ncbi:MAG: recombinase family protein [Fusicatenibacter sp.]|nr:recombinase family protein [Fusicatenibacter sp.]